MLSNGLTLFASGLAAVAGVSALSPARVVHSELAKRADGDVQLHKRFSGTKWTFFDVGLGACGKVNVASDFVVALNADQFGSGYPGPNCEKMITMTYNGKTAQAKIMDRCPGCPYGGLDLSRSLFSYFAAESLGVISGDWSFVESSGGSPAAEPTPAKIATPVSKPTPSSSKAPAPVGTASTRAPAVDTPAPSLVRTTSSSARVAQTTPAPFSAARGAPSPSAAGVQASSSHSTNGAPKTLAAVPQIAAVSRPPVASSSSTASTPSSTVHSSNSAAAKVSNSATRASPTSSKVSSTATNNTIASTSASSASPSPTDAVTVIEKNVEAIAIIISRLGDLLKKLRLEKDH